MLSSTLFLMYQDRWTVSLRWTLHCTGCQSVSLCWPNPKPDDSCKDVFNHLIQFQFIFCPSVTCNTLYLLSEDWWWYLWTGNIHCSPRNIAEIESKGGWGVAGNSCVQTWRIAARVEPLPWWNLCLSTILAERVVWDSKYNILLYGHHLQVVTTVASS